MKKKLVIIIILLVIILVIYFLFWRDIKKFVWTYINDKKSEKLLKEKEPEIICENWFLKHSLRTINNWIIFCSNDKWIRSWNFLMYNSDWEIIEKWLYKNDKKSWKWIYYNNWKEIWYGEYKNGLRDGLYYNIYYGSWLYKSWYREWLWIDGFYNNWQKKSDFFYKFWRKNWIQTWYYEDGSVEQIISYRNWYPHWKSTSYYRNWQIKEEVNYKYWNIDWIVVYYNEDWEIENKSFYYEWHLVKEEKKDEINNNLSNQLEELSDIIEHCFWKDVIEDSKYRADNGSHDFFEYFCNQTLSWLESQKDDNFWLKQILIEITKSWIDYSKIRIKSDACWEDLWVILDTCNNVIDDEEREIINKIRELYIEFSNILKNIKNENQEIDIDKYFYIPNKIISWNDSIYILFYIDDEKSKTILNDMLLQEIINKKNEKDKKLNSNKKSNEQINYEKLVNLVNICMWEDILHSRVFSKRVTLSYNNYLSLCNYTLWELENFNLTWSFNQLRNTLISINKEWIEYANIWRNEDILIEDKWPNSEWVYENWWWTPEWDELFKREDKNIENFKINYKKLKTITKNIKEKYKITPEIDFYIMYSVINENLFRLILNL